MDEAKTHGGIERMDPLHYTAYMGLLTDVFKRLLAYYGEVERMAQTSEGESMALYVQKIIATVYALRLRFSFSPEYYVRPGVDLADSGFPQFHDVQQLDADLSTRSDRLPKLPEVDLSRQMLLELLMHPDTDVPVRGSEECRKLQWQIAERAYLKSLSLKTQFFRFTPGELMAADAASFSPERGRRAYHFSWGCYDPLRNRPSVYFMLMTQDESEAPLNNNNPEYVRFLQAIERIASRAPDGLSPIATRLDEEFAALYPKALKRFNIGPLVSPMLWDGREMSACPKLAQVLLPYFEEAKLAPNDFCLFFSTELVFSEREVMPATIKSVLGLDKARQIFHVPKTDLRALRRGATAYKTYGILPHRLRQHLSDEALAEVQHLLDADGLEMLTYQRNIEGVTNVG